MSNVLQFTTRVDLSGAKTGVAELAGVFQDGMDAAQGAVESASAGISSALANQASAAQSSSEKINSAYQQIEAQGLETLDALNAATAESATVTADAAASATDAAAGQAAAVSASVDIQASAYRQLSTATLEAATARRQMADAQNAFLAGELPAVDAEALLAEAMERSAIASEQLTLSKANLAEVTAYLAATSKREAEVELVDAGAKTENAAASNVAAAAEETEATAIRSTISARMAASSEIRVLEGNIQGSTRAAGALLSMIPGLGAALQAAFTVFGAIALLEVIIQIGTAFKKMREELALAAQLQQEAFADAHDKAREQIDDIEVTNAKLQEQIDKVTHNANTQDGLAVMLAEAHKEADALAVSLDEDRKQLERILKENDPSIWKVMWSAVTNSNGRTVETTQQGKEMVADQRNLAAQLRGINATYDLNIGLDPKSVKESGKKRADAIHEAYQAQIDAYQKESTRLSNQVLGGDNARIDNSTKVANVEGRIQQLRDMQEEDDAKNKRGQLESQKAVMSHGDPDKTRLKEIETKFADINRQKQLIDGMELEPAAAEKFWAGYLTAFRHGTDEYRHVLDEVLKYSQNAHKQLFDEILKSSPDQAVHLAHGPEERQRAIEAATKDAKENARELLEVEKAAAKMDKELAKQGEDLAHTGDRWDGFNKAVTQGAEVAAQNAANLAAASDKWLLATGAIRQLAADQDAATRSTTLYKAQLAALNDELVRLQSASKFTETPLGKVNTDPTNAAQIQQIKNEIAKLTGSHNVNQVEQAQKAAQDIAQPYLQAFSKIDTAWRKVQNDLIAGNKNIRQDFIQMGVSMVQSAAAAAEKMLADWVRHEILKLAASQAAATATTAVAATSAAAQGTIEQHSLAVTLSKEAVKAAAKSYAWAASWGGPIAGAIAAAVAFTAVEGLAALAAFEKGGVVDGSPGMPVPIMAHAGERVLSVPQTQMFERMVNNGNSPGEGNMHVHFSPTISSFDHQGMRSAVRASSDEVVSIVKEAYKAGKLK